MCWRHFQNEAADMDRRLLYFLIAVAIGAMVGLLIAAAARCVRWARKGSPGAALIGWALLFLGAGMNPQPPPQEQVEEANRQKRLKQDDESGDPER